MKRLYTYMLYMFCLKVLTYSYLPEKASYPMQKAARERWKQRLRKQMISMCYNALSYSCRLEFSGVVYTKLYKPQLYINRYFCKYFNDKTTVKLQWLCMMLTNILKKDIYKGFTLKLQWHTHGNKKLKLNGNWRVMANYTWCVLDMYKQYFCKPQ